MSSLIAVPTTLNKMSTFMNKVVVRMVFAAHIGFRRRGHVAARFQQLDDQLASSGREVRAQRGPFLRRGATERDGDAVRLLSLSHAVRARSWT